MAEWKDFSTVPRDSTPVLIQLDKKMLGSYIHVGVFDNRGTGVIAGRFVFDLPIKMLYWAELPEPKK